MKVSELRKTVESLKELLEASDARATTIKGIDEFIGILAARDDKRVEELISELEALAVPSDQPNDIAVRRHIKALNSANLERQAFEIAFAALQADDRVGAVEADHIFKQYHGRDEWQKIYGDKPRWRKKIDALKAIQTSFIERLTQEQKHEQVSKATPW